MQSRKEVTRIALSCNYLGKKEGEEEMRKRKTRKCRGEVNEVEGNKGM